MALPKWITPAGVLGIVPELEYYEFPLDAYDASGGTLAYSLISGQLPLGLQIISAGRIQGIPVSAQNTGDQNETYRFTIRVKNASTGGLSDRTFSITITNIAPPIISFPQKNTYLGLYLDGTEVILQLEAIEFTPGAALTWSVKSGDLPPGLSLSQGGLLSGYVQPIASNLPGVDDGWDQSVWSYLGWDFTIQAISKTFTFVIEVFDGVSYDQSTYTLKVFPRSSLTADNDELPVDTDSLESGIGLTIDGGNKHNPIIMTTQEDLFPVRQGSYFSFNIDAIDLDGDIVNYSVPALSSGAFDEQTNIIGNGVPYIPTIPINSRIFEGIFPKVSSDILSTDTTVSTSSRDFLNVNWLPGDVVKVLDPNNLWRDATIGTSTTVRITGSTRVTANSGGWLTQSSSGANAIITSSTPTTGVVNVTGNIITGNINTVGTQPTFNITLSGNIRANVGQFITQSSTASNATITSNTLMYITLTGANATTSTFNIGDYITQNGSTGNALVVERAINTSLIYVNFLSGSFVANVGNIKLNGANINAVPDSIVSTANVVSVLYTAGSFINSTAGWLSLGGANVAVYPTANVKTPNSVLISANVGDFITQNGSTGNATVSESTSAATYVEVVFTSGTFNTAAGNLRINGSNVNVAVSLITQTLNPFIMRANIGEYITQGNANARVTSNVIATTALPVEFLANNFSTGFASGNIKLNGANVNAYPSSIACQTDVTATYTNANTFDINNTDASAVARVNAVSTSSNITSLVSVNVTLGSLSSEGTVGFDEAKFDQGTLSLPGGLTIDTTTGWITGQLPSQTINQIDYDFEIVAYKRDDSSYLDSQLYTLTVLGDLNNRIEWITSSDLGTIENGRVSDLFVTAQHTNPIAPKVLVYRLKLAGAYRLPQGLKLTSTGLLSGRVSFELFTYDKGLTTIDGDSTSFDRKYNFIVTAYDLDGTVSSDRTFTLKVVARNIKPYEDLYLQALPSAEQRLFFSNIINDSTIFPSELIYRPEDPYFGLAKSIRTLFLAGLNPSKLSDYIYASLTNHFTKRVTFGDIKTARALDANFNVKYEVVYVEVNDDNTNLAGQGPASTIDLSGVLDTPYYDANGNTYTTAYPNSFSNMNEVIAAALGYANKGALPDWMTSRQIDGKVLGFTRAVVLAYTKPESSELIAYRLRERNFNLNTIDFTVDRYRLDNKYSENFDIPSDYLRFNANITAAAGSVISQPLTNATALVLENAIDQLSVKVQYISNDFRVFDLSNVSYVTATLSGNITAAAGNFITQPGYGANAEVLKSVVNSNTVDLHYANNFLNIGAGNIYLNGIAANVYPITTISLNDPTGGNVAVNGIANPVYPISAYKSPEVGEFITSSETTFDRYPPLEAIYTKRGTVDYAVSTSFEDINGKPVSEIQAEGGLDGVIRFKAGQRLVFAKQEFFQDQGDLNDENQGWNRVIALWDGDSWDYDTNLTDNPYTEEYGYTVESWSAYGFIEKGKTILDGGIYYRTEEDFYTGAFFQTTSITGNITMILSGNITASVGNLITQPSSGASLTILADVTNSTNVLVHHTSNIAAVLGANVQLNGAWLSPNVNITTLFGDQTVSTVLTELPATTPPDLTPGLGWDTSDVVPGYDWWTANSYIVSDGIVTTTVYPVPNQRIGIWTVNIDDDVVSLTFDEEINNNDSLYVKYGDIYGATNIFYDINVIPDGLSDPTWATIPQEIRAQASLRAVVGTGATAGQVIAVTVVSGGSGYKTTPPPVVTFLGDGSGARAVAQIINGSIVSVTVSSPGADYTIAPIVSISAFTIFDGNGTRFFDYRDEYVVPEEGDKYIKFTKIGVFT